MTEDSAAEHAGVYGVELEKVDESKEIREDLPDQGVMFFDAHCTEAIYEYFAKMQSDFGSPSAKGRHPLRLA